MHCYWLACDWLARQLRGQNGKNGKNGQNALAGGWQEELLARIIAIFKRV